MASPVYESDYILRIIASLGGLLRRIVAELRTDPAEANARGSAAAGRVLQ